jgi:hypothetical protein
MSPEYETNEPVRGQVFCIRVSNGGRYHTLPTVFAGINDVVQISAGSDMILALRRDGTIVQGFFGDPTDVPLAIRAEL